MATSNPVLAYTTTVPASRTVDEIQRLLRRHRARTFALDYDPAGDVVGVAFTVETATGDRTFRIAPNVAAVQKVLYPQALDHWMRDRQAKQRQRDERSRNVAWRQIFRLLEAQLALVQVGLVPIEKALLADLLLPDGRTFGEALEAAEYRVQLPAGSVLQLPAPRE